MNSTCKSPNCRAPIVWKVGANGKPEPFDEDGRSHFATCPDAARFRGEDFDPWLEMDTAERYEFQLEEQRREYAAVSDCRSNGRDPQHGDVWCRNCYMPRPPGYRCDRANFGSEDKGTVVRYGRVKGEVVALRGDALRDFLRSNR